MAVMVVVDSVLGDGAEYFNATGLLGAWSNVAGIHVGKMKIWPWLVRLLPGVATSIARRH